MTRRFAGVKVMVAALAIPAVAQIASAATFIVRPEGGGDYPTIQQAVTAAANADSILLANGTFRGAGNHDIDFQGKALTIASQGGDPAQCVVDCEGTADTPRRGFRFYSDEGASAVLQGFKISNGNASQGGGIYCQGTSPTFKNLILSGNKAGAGGGIFCERSSPMIDNCVFLDNLALQEGGGILSGIGFGDNAAPTIRNCTFANNSATSGGAIQCSYTYPEITACTFRENSALSGGGLACYFATPTVTDCLFQANSAEVGGGVWCEAASGPVITGCTFAMNEGAFKGGGIYSKESVPSIRNTIIAWSTKGEAVYSRTGPYVPELSCCDLYGNRDGDWVGAIEGQKIINGNQSSDPLFCNRWVSNFTISASSVCAAEHSGSCGQIGAFGVACNEVPVERVTWGRIRAGFR
jgi:predicted outer membrane repeat protein